MTFFFDNNFSTHLVKFISDLYTGSNHIFEHLKDSLDPSTTDPVWIETLSKRNDLPVILTLDRRIIKTPANKKALGESGLTAFIFSAKRFSGEKLIEQSWRTLKVFPDIIQKCNEIQLSLEGSHTNIFQITGDERILQIQSK